MSDSSTAVSAASAAGSPAAAAPSAAGRSPGRSGCVLAVEVMFGRQRYAHPLGVPFPNGVSLGILVNGAIQGMLYAFLAFGLILVYRANRIINFAHAGLGLVPAVAGAAARHQPALAVRRRRCS